jgi:hypothetical protein
MRTQMPKTHVDGEQKYTAVTHLLKAQFVTCFTVWQFVMPGKAMGEETRIGFLPAQERRGLY